MLLLKVTLMSSVMEYCSLEENFNNYIRYLKLTKRFFGRLQLVILPWDTYLAKTRQSLPM
jgi:hypothetical protein